MAYFPVLNVAKKAAKGKSPMAKPASVTPKKWGSAANVTQSKPMIMRMGKLTK